jgi:predicted adenylyl cyclase CyaB
MEQASLNSERPLLPRRNVEVKVRVTDLAATEKLAAALADRGPFELEQDDTFFACPNGRLKLRQLAPDRGELIHYERPDQDGPRLSRFLIAPTADPAALREALTRALGPTGRVRKTRRLYLAGDTRIHLDRVEQLGDFLELEVVLTPDRSVAEGEAEARRIMAALGVDEDDLIRGAYVDLLNDRG